MIDRNEPIRRQVIQAPTNQRGQVIVNNQSESLISHYLPKASPPPLALTAVTMATAR